MWALKSTKGVFELSFSGSQVFPYLNDRLIHRPVGAWGSCQYQDNPAVVCTLGFAGEHKKVILDIHVIAFIKGHIRCCNSPFTAWQVSGRMGPVILPSDPHWNTGPHLNTRLKLMDLMAACTFITPYASSIFCQLQAWILLACHPNRQHLYSLVCIPRNSFREVSFILSFPVHDYKYLQMRQRYDGGTSG